mmetsp:Transcript_18109/g.58587  ORF Transcript_18109/g.58587 Transcript_18109/m.58587 type:complete len:259 (+) Transcript_18109:1364-2140(+)|eukprot:CAMPEP_0182852158 /NCGR_PEP_ID=MMETSP0034_2-20130328/11_1 /TAXON_ID=156128 /ORGANISM="Nephroselmis pyriformis, Strain CCMP717" /LENGTH=258 /DNA_ID=CAMNT_0024982853 /DNA_START=315 /DNA_END=1091 /DNA_ORIENTATION=+
MDVPSVLSPEEQGAFQRKLMCDSWRHDPHFQRSISFQELLRLLRAFAGTGEGGRPAAMRDAAAWYARSGDGSAEDLLDAPGGDLGSREVAYTASPPTCSLTYAWDTPVRNILAALEAPGTSEALGLESFFVDVFLLDQSDLDFSKNLLQMSHMYAAVEKHVVVYNAALVGSEWCAFEVAVRALAGRPFAVLDASRGPDPDSAPATARAVGLRLSMDHKYFLLLHLPRRVNAIDLDLLTEWITAILASRAALGMHLALM